MDSAHINESHVGSNSDYLRTALGALVKPYVKTIGPSNCYHHGNFYTKGVPPIVDTAITITWLKGY